MRTGFLVVFAGLVGLATACAPPATQTPVAEGPAAVEVPVVPRPVTLPVSLNAVMVALVDHASEPLWLDAYEPPTTDAGWREAEHHAYQMAVGGKLIQLAGTGPNDAAWVAEQKWISMADEMGAAGMDALGAAKARNVELLNGAGDRLVAACEACHTEYKLGLPSMGLYKSPDYPVPERQ